MRARAFVLAGLVAALAGCGGEQTVSPRPATVEGSVPTAPTTTSSSGGGATTTAGGSSTTSAPSSGGGGANGKALFASNGCNSCHTYKPAGANAKIGPDLDKLVTYAKQAKQPLPAFTHESIVNPKAYVQPGYQPVMPSFASLPKNQVDALVAFLTKKS
jgi:cytochrome c2